MQTNILTVPLRKHFDMSNTAPSTNITAAQAALDIKYATSMFFLLDPTHMPPLPSFSVNCAFVAGLCE